MNKDLCKELQISLFKTLKSAFVGLLWIILVLIFVLGSWIVWEQNSDVLSDIDIDAGKVELLLNTPYNVSFQDGNKRTYRYIRLKTENLGNIEAFISMPKVISGKGLPVVLIMGGLEVDAKIFKQIQDPGDNIYVVYKYPYTPEYWYEGTPIVEMPIIRKSLLQVPSQALTLYQWILQQSWTDKERVTFTGYSFGAMFIPAIYHLADTHKEELNPGIIAYGGADISDLLYTNMNKVSEPLRTFGAWFGEQLIYSLEPSHHLAYMNNEFLLINSTKDHQISTYSWKKLHSLVPQPKTVVILDDGHMHFRKPELTRKLVKISSEWFRKRGLIN